MTYNKILWATLLVFICLNGYVTETRASIHEKVFTEDCDWLSPHISGWNKYKELFYGLDNKRCLEIGAFEGRSTIYFAENYCNGKGSYVDVVDTWMGSRDIDKDHIVNLYDRFTTNLKPFIDDHRVNIHQGSSSDMLMKLIKEVKDGKREKYDFIYIDASHDANDVLLDAVLSWELLKNDGLMFFDDYELSLFQDKPWLTPKVAIDGFLNSYSSMYEILEKKYQVKIKKIADSPQLLSK